MKDFLDLVGRILISTIFLYEAYDSIYYFHFTKRTMTEYGLNWSQDLLLTGAIILLVLGGIMVLIGYRSSFGSLLLLLYYIPVTFIVHSFWNDPEKVQRIQGIMFMKNLAIMGGLLMIIVNGSGKFSIKRLLATIRV